MPSFLERGLRLPSAVLALIISQAYGAALDARQAQSTTLPAPIVIPADQNWDGYDGSWSSFTLRVGTPQQFVRTFVSFASYQTLVVLPQGCGAATDPGACAFQRGWLFNQSASTTWTQKGIFDVSIERNLKYSANAVYGYDTVGLAGVGQGGPTLQNTTVGGMAVEDFYLGILGINPKPTNFTSFNEPSPSYMTLLKDQNLIPSVSAGLNVGARYRNGAGAPASLTLGGYDDSKYIPNNATFTFGADNDRDIVVAIQSITTDLGTSAQQPQSLLSAPVYAYVDSTIPQIWLPLAACQAFETAFGLTYNNATDLYLVNSSLHTTLSEQNPNVTFTLAQAFSGGPTVNITLPYGAFDLTAQPPYQGLPNQSYYFPLRRAANSSQYTLGRAFLQEAYITIDWEVQQFNISQMSWNQSAPPHIVAISPFTQDFSTGGFTNTGTSSTPNKGIGAGAIAGIVVGAIAVIALIVGAFIWHFRRRHRGLEKLSEKHEPANDIPRNAEPTGFFKAELEGCRPVAPISDTEGLLSPASSSGANESSRQGTPRSPNAPSSLGTYFQTMGGNSDHSPTTSSGEGTYDSSHSNRSQVNTLLSPLSASSGSDTGGHQSAIYEMAGDMPTIKEKDGKALSEKEAIAHREKVYNGVEYADSSSYDDSELGTKTPRRVNADDVVIGQAIGGDDESTLRGDASPSDSSNLHRSFSFELKDDSKELYE